MKTITILHKSDTLNADLRQSDHTGVQVTLFSSHQPNIQKSVFKLLCGVVIGKKTRKEVQQKKQQVYQECKVKVR